MSEPIEEIPRFEPDDIDILDLALIRNPELRICAWIVKRARMTGLKYPVLGPQGLFSLYSSEEVVIAGHRLSRDDVTRLMPPEFFPITNEEALMDRAHIAFIKCQYEITRKMLRDPQFTAVLHGVGTMGGANPVEPND